MRSMRITLEIRPEAWDELNAISEKHLRLAGEISAQRITDKILDTLELLETSPLLGTECKEYPFNGTRYRRLICGNYICLYKAIDDMVYVYHIVDGRTDYPKLFESEA
ncbi:MAG: type II toxin-antitoxin system RelE/ParE family toxin [Ruminococcaceae bacterium]|nr:type II toxin-antitoxin system RelE/ParE family toxin [Oscillospiraceae bacterium]